MKDPIIEEVRKTRLKIERELEKKGISYDEHLIEEQKKYQDRLVRREPVPSSKRTSKYGSSE